MILPDALPPNPAVIREAEYIKRRLDAHERGLYWATTREIGYGAVRMIEARRWAWVLSEFSRYLNRRNDGVYL